MYSVVIDGDPTLWLSLPEDLVLGSVVDFILSLDLVFVLVVDFILSLGLVLVLVLVLVEDVECELYCAEGSALSSKEAMQHTFWPPSRRCRVWMKCWKPSLT